MHNPGEIADLKDHHLITWGGELSSNNPAFLQSKLDPEPISSNSLLSQRTLAEQGLGIALLPEFLGASSAMLQRVLPELSHPIGIIWMLYHSDLRHTARIRAFVSFMQEALQKELTLSPA